MDSEAVGCHGFGTICELAARPDLLYRFFLVPQSCLVLLTNASCEGSFFHPSICSNAERCNLKHR